MLNSARNTVQANNVRCHELFVNRVATNWLLRKVISSNAIETVEAKTILCAASPVLSLITLIQSINLGANLEHTFRVLTYG